MTCSGVAALVYFSRALDPPGLDELPAGVTAYYNIKNGIIAAVLVFLGATLHTDQIYGK